MLPRTLMKCIVVTLLVLLSVADPAEAFSLFDLIFGSTVNKVRDDTEDALKTVSTYVLGGGTAIVYDAINLNALGIGPTLRNWLGSALQQGVFGLIEGIFYVAWNAVYYIVVGIGYLIWGIISLKNDAFWNGLYIIVPIIIDPESSFFGYNIHEMLGISTATVGTAAVAANSRNIRSVGSVVNVLRGRREAGPSSNNLEETLVSASMRDHMHCLPLVLCAIYAEPEEFVGPLESKFKKAFRSLFVEDFKPSWATEYVKAADQGESLKSPGSCQSLYPTCRYSAERLRSLIFQSLDLHWHEEEDNQVET